jgi:F-type H+-transporting ATPase subunit delta
MPGRYANALFELGSEARATDEVAGLLDDFMAMMDSSDDLRRLVRSPVFSAEEQTNAIMAVLARAGIGGLAANFIGLVAKNRRLFALPDMIRGFRALVAEARGEVTAEVTSAETLSAAQKKALAAELKKALGKDANISETVDPSLLGGLIVKVGSRMVDSSLKSKLNSLRIAMKEVG